MILDPRYIDLHDTRHILGDDSVYMEFENRYLRRRFHKDVLSPKLTVTTTDEHDMMLPFKHVSSSSLHDISAQQRFDQFTQKHNGKKPLLILDVDNTLLYSRFFSEEMRVNDVVTYFFTENVPRNNAMVVRIQKTLTLNMADTHLIDELGSEHLDISLWIDDNKTLCVESTSLTLFHST